MLDFRHFRIYSIFWGMLNKLIKKSRLLECLKSMFSGKNKLILSIKNEPKLYRFSYFENPNKMRETMPKN